MVIIDCFIHSYEADAVAVRLRELRDVVDLHIAVQGLTTFRGERRTLTPLNAPRVVDTAVELPAGAPPFECERHLRDQGLEQARMFAALHFPGEEVLFLVADGDEIPHPDAITEATTRAVPSVLPTDYREWFIDWRAPEGWQLEHQPTLATGAAYDARGGATAARYACREWEPTRPRGWHLSTLGNAALASVKLSTFAHAEYDTEAWNDTTQLDRFRAAGRDLLDRFDLEPTTDLPACTGEFPHLLAPTET